MARPRAILHGGGWGHAMDQDSNQHLEALSGGMIDVIPIGDPEPKPRPRLAMGTREIDPGLQLEAIPDAVFSIDLQGNIDDLNELAEALVGYDRGELVGRRAGTVIANIEHAGDKTDRTRFLPASAGATACHRSGRAIAVAVMLSPHVHGSTLAIVRPVHAASREGLRDDDIAQIAHDLKGPLTTISLETELLDLDAADREVLTRAVARIMHNLGFLDRMIHDLLDLCAINSDELSLQRSQTEMRELVERTVERVVATRDRHRVFVHAPDRITIQVDDGRIERVLANLVQNALKYSPPPAGVVVRLDLMPGRVRICVTDNGPGIANVDTETIFDKYRRVPATRGHDGSGLGLYVSKRIVDAHGGRIGVESIHGAGAQFYFELPTE
ncbi:MAG: ATP-binding protein [Kofleriaceae bacterium]